MTGWWRAALTGLALWAVAAEAAVPRQGEATGLIVSANGDEEIQFVAEPSWRRAEVEQDLRAGDQLRTGPAGGLALRFIDRTVIRVHRNTQLVIKQLGEGADTELQLDQGQVWARAAKGGTGVDIATPSATAAIRGTDWSLNVETNGRTTLIVTAGQVELRNALGQVLVGPGEAAVAEIGRAPTKIVLAQPPGREQMLYYLSARSAFAFLPLNDLATPAMRAERDRLLRRDTADLSDEEKVTLAELALRYDGREPARTILDSLSARDPPPDLAARRRLIEGMDLALSNRWDEAAAAFAEAEPGLQGRRRSSALFGRYLTLILGGRADDATALAASVDALPDDPDRAMTRALLAAVTGDLPGAAAILDEAERRFPSDTYLPVFRGLLAVALGDATAARAASIRADRVDADDPNAIQLRAMVLSDFDWDIEAARAELERAVTAAPGSAEAWNELGLARLEQDDTEAARAAFEEAIRLDPYDPVPRANLAILLLDANRLAEAKAQIDAAQALDPSFYVTHLALGRYLLQSGDLAGAKEEFLAAVAANPLVSNSSLGLAIAHYQDREIDLALQALDDAERLDPEDPIVSLVRTVIALNESRAGEAIRAARETYRRYQRRGRAFTTLASTRSDGSYLFNAFDNLTLSDWGRYYGDLLFNPFDSASHFYQAVAPVGDVAADGAEPGASLPAAIQGLLLEPLAASARNRYDDLLRRPFADFTVGGDLLLDTDGVLGGGGHADVQAFSNDGVPFAVSAFVDYANADNDAPAVVNDAVSGTLFAGAELGLSDRVLFFGTVAKNWDVNGSTLALGLREEAESLTYNTGVGFSHRFGESNMLLAFVGANGAHVEGETGGADLLQADEDSGLLALTHMVDVDGVTVRYGAEGQVTDGETTIVGVSATDGDERAGRLYLDAATEIVTDLHLQAGAYLSHVDSDAGRDFTRLDPRLALALQAGEGQWLRVGLRSDTDLPLGVSLAPVATAGLTPFATPLEDGGRTLSAIARWDAEWSERVFTSLEYQHQEIDDYSVTITDASLVLTLLGLTPVLAASEGRLDVVSASADAWLSDEFGAFARGTVAWSESDDTGFDLPLVPDWTARFGLTWVHPRQIRVTVAENLIGPRDGDVFGNNLSTAATTDVTITWEPLDKHLSLGLGAFNLFDEDYELATGFQAPGLTFKLSGEVRF